MTSFAVDTRTWPVVFYGEHIQTLLALIRASAYTTCDRVRIDIYVTETGIRSRYNPSFPLLLVYK